MGGEATYFYTVRNKKSLYLIIKEAQKKKMPFLILGGGSNIILPDAGFDGLVIQIALRGIRFQKRKGGIVTLQASAGELWDGIVKRTVCMGLGGIESLSGIPGLVGATPIQNVGAYGQEVSQTIESVEFLDTDSLEYSKLSATECEFSYRSSLFKREETKRRVITRVNYLFKKNKQNYDPKIKYTELRKHIELTLAHTKYKNKKITQNPKKYLSLIRNVIFELRSHKGMLIDPTNIYSRSVGSFFTNPIVTKNEYEQLEKKTQALKIVQAIAHFPSDTYVKVSAAWLIENAGFIRGTRRGGVGISIQHALALVNYNGTTQELLNFATEIEKKVESLFGIRLIREPTIFS